MRINEVYVDRDLSGDRVEYVELSGPIGEPLAGLFLKLLGPDGGTLYDLAVTADDAGLIGGTGTWVVGGSLANGRVDQQYSLNTWGLDNSSGGVQLVKRTGAPEIIDTLGYGGVNTIEGPPLTLPTVAGDSLGRRVLTADSNSNTADFCVQNDSCGAPNNVCK